LGEGLKGKVLAIEAAKEFAPACKHLKLNLIVLTQWKQK
jgi:hypothetical protein